MNLYLRLIILLIKSRWKPRLELMEQSVLTFHVLPSDLDINMHMNNGRFNSIMDLGRIDIMLRNGLLGLLFKNKWIGLIGSINTRFKRPLKLFQRYELHSQIIHWDEKWTWIDHKMYRKEKLICSALVQTLIRRKEGNIPTSELMELMKFDHQSPPASDEIKHLQRFAPLK